jgi:hypothetical protein
MAFFGFYFFGYHGFRFLILISFIIRVLAVKGCASERIHANEMVFNISHFFAAMSHAFSKSVYKILPYATNETWNQFLVLKFKSQVHLKGK